MIGIASLIASVLLVFCGATLSGAVAGAAVSDWHAVEAFSILTVCYALVGGLTLLAVSGKQPQFDRHQVFVGAIAMWLTLVLAAMPGFLIVEGLDPIVAFYESASAAVTMGDSLVPVGAMSNAMILYRSVTAWLGGLLTLILAIYVLGRYSVGGIPNRDLRFVLHGFSRGNPRLFQTLVEIFIPYIAVTLMCAAALVLARVDPVHAVVLALNILSTNGFVGWQSGGTVLSNQLAEIVMMIFMIVGATSIIFMRAILGRRLHQTREQGETLLFVAVVVVGVFLIGGFGIASAPSGQDLAAIFLGQAFDVVSIVTTTGMTHDVRQGIGIPVEIALGLALLGGCAYSTAGGLKLFRLSSMLHHSLNEVRRLVYPNQILPRSIDTEKHMLASTRAIWSALFAGLIFILATMVAFAALGHEFLPSLALAIGSFCNVGNIVDAYMFAPAETSVPALSLFIISISGLAGRLELLVILAAFARRKWA